MADLVDELSTTNTLKQKTIFAPINEAFEKVSPEILAAVTGSGGGNTSSLLTDVLLYHVVPDSIVLSNDLVCGQEVIMANGNITTTLCGGGGIFYQADAGYTTGGSGGVPKIIDTNITTCDGVVHAIDELLLPW